MPSTPTPQCNSEKIDAETARMFYESARAELISRIGLRDNAIVAYLGAIGAIFGIALGSNSNISILLVVPMLALGAELLISQHTELIGALSHYCSHEIGKELISKMINFAQWDNSRSLAAYSKSAIYRRTYGNISLIFTPALLAITITGFNSRKYLASTEWECFAWWLGLILTGMILLIEKRAHDFRNKRFNQTFGMARE